VEKLVPLSHGFAAGSFAKTEHPNDFIFHNSTIAKQSLASCYIRSKAAPKSFGILAEVSESAMYGQVGES